MAIQIVKGEDKKIPVTLTNKDGSRFDLTGNTEVTGCFLNDSLPNLKVTKTSGAIVLTTPNELGELEITSTDTETAALAKGATQNFELELDKGTDKTIVQFVGQLNIIERLCT